MPLQNKYGGSGGVYHNPNETEEERIKRYQAEALRNSVADEQIKSQQREYDQLSDVGAGPKGRSVGSRNTFVAASPFEHLAHVVAAGIKGKKRKKAKGELEESLGKRAAARAVEVADKRIKAERVESRAENKEVRDEQLLIIKAKQAEDLGERYKSLDESAKNRLALDERKLDEIKANNIRRSEDRMAALDKKATDFRPTVSGERKLMSNMRFGIEAVASAGETFEDSYARPFAGLPVVSQFAVDNATSLGLNPRDLAGMLDKVGAAGDIGEDDNFQDAARWMAGWRQGYTLWQRNELFGATLTPSEQKAWNAAGEINLNMDAAEIRKRVSQAETIMRKRADSGAYTSITAGQNPALWTGMTSSGFDAKTYGQNMAAPAAPTAPTAPTAGAAPTAPAQPEERKLISYKDYMPGG